MERFGTDNSISLKNTNIFLFPSSEVNKSDLVQRKVYIKIEDIIDSLEELKCSLPLVSFLLKQHFFSK